MMRVEPVEAIDREMTRLSWSMRASGRPKGTIAEADLTLRASPASTRFAISGRSHGPASTGREKRPSKPPGCRSSKLLPRFQAAISMTGNESPSGLSVEGWRPWQWGRGA